MKKRIFAMSMLMILLLSTLLTTVACKKDPTVPQGQETKPIKVDENDPYNYGDLDCDNKTFTFLNVDEGRWNMITALVPEATTGDEVVEAIYSRNAYIEDLYNVSLDIVNEDIYETAEYVRNEMLTNVSTIDAALVIGDGATTLMAENHLKNLMDNPYLQLYENWWNQNLREASQFSGQAALYYVQSDISLTAFDSTWCIVANLDMMNRLEMEIPYDMVRNKEWTMDTFFSLAKDGMNLNGDSSYIYTKDTKCTFGFTTYVNFTAAALNGAGLTLVKKNELGNPEFSGKGDTFYEICVKYNDFFANEGQGLIANTDEAHYETIFGEQRALFAGIEVKATRIFRTQDFKYGILPIPMANGNQENYQSTVTYHAPLLVIPQNNNDDKRTGIILDTMAYLSQKKVLPIYYDRNMSFKSLKDPDSVDMLNIIRDTRVFETSLLYGWTMDYYKDLIKFVCATDITAAHPSSLAATYEESINTVLTNFIRS